MMNLVQATNDNFAVTIKNNGGYIAEFYINYKVGSKSYKLDSGAFSLGFSGVLTIPKNAIEVYLVVDIWIFGGLRHLERRYIGSINQCYNLTGTIFDAAMNEVPCNLLGSTGPSNNQICNKCCCCCCCCKK